MKKFNSIFVVIFVVFFVIGCSYKSNCKKNYNLSNISFNDMNVTYDGREHCLLINGDIPDELEIEYHNNKLIDSGSVTATATIKNKATSEIIKVFDATLTVSKRNVKIRVSEVLEIFENKVLSNNYEVVEGSFIEGDLDKLDLDLVIMKQFIPVFATKYYNVTDVIGVEHNLKSNYEITIENKDVIIHNTSFLSSDMVVYDDNTSYDKDYFESLNNSLSYEDLMDRIKTYDVNSENYICPFDFGEYNLNNIDEFFKDNPDKLEEVMNASRYANELKYLTSYFNNQLKYYNSKIEVVKDWIYDILDLSYVGYSDIIVTETPYEFVKNKGYEGTQEEFIKIFKKSYSSIISSLYFDGFDDSIKNQCYLAASLLKYPDNLPYELEDYDASTYPNDYLKWIEFKQYNDLISQKLQTLPKWDDFKKVLLGYAGTETDYPNKPVFSSLNKDGNIVEFYFNYLDTTFKLVEKDLDGNVIKTVNSSSEETIMELKFQNISNIKDKYYFSNYFDSTSDKNLYHDFIMPTYSIYLEKDEFGNGTKLLVSYIMKKRAVGPYDLPVYISKEKMDEYLERNKELVKEGALTSNGELVEDIKSNKWLYMNFCRLESSFYKLIPTIRTEYGKEVPNPANEFGFDYYELNNYSSNMTGLMFKTLYKCLYEYCGYTEEDLIADNNQFNMRTDVYKPLFKVTVEYKLIDGILYVSIPENSIYNDEQSQIYSIELLKYAQKEK